MAFPRKLVHGVGEIFRQIEALKAWAMDTFLTKEAGSGSGGDTTISRVGEVILTLDVDDYPGTLVLDGALITEKEYPALFKKYKDKYLVAGTTDTVKLPDLRNRFVKAANTLATVGNYEAQSTQLPAHAHGWQFVAYENDGMAKFSSNGMVGGDDYLTKKRWFGFHMKAIKALPTKNPDDKRGVNTTTDDNGGDSTSGFIIKTVGNSALTQPACIVGIYRVYYK